MNQSQGSAGGETRPSVLEALSTTQMDELERQYKEHDHSAWNTLADSYGWTAEQANEVWKWFGERPKRGQDTFGSTGSSSGGNR
jgi:hypothetical protein